MHCTCDGSTTSGRLWLRRCGGTCAMSTSWPPNWMPAHVRAAHCCAERWPTSPGAPGRLRKHERLGLLRAACVPPFEQNARIELPDGRHYVADFLWRALRAVLEIDSVEYHLNPAAWQATMNRHLALETVGFSVAHRPPSAVRDHPTRFVQEISAWLASRATLLVLHSRDAE